MKFPFLENWFLSPLPRTLSPRNPSLAASTSPDEISLLRPPQGLKPVPKCSPIYHLQSQTSLVDRIEVWEEKSRAKTSPKTPKLPKLSKVAGDDSGHLSLEALLGFEALTPTSSQPPVLSNLVAGRRRIEHLKFRPPRASRGNSDHFQPELDLVIVMEVVAGVVMQVVLKFGDHRRWSESEARGAHAQPLRAARGGASGLLWPGSLFCQLQFFIVSMLVFGLLNLEKV